MEYGEKQLAIYLSMLHYLKHEEINIYALLKLTTRLLP